MDMEDEFRIVVEILKKSLNRGPNAKAVNRTLDNCKNR